jgi:PAT family beta-lactamase induction signal transducer AmpG
VVKPLRAGAVGRRKAADPLPYYRSRMTTAPHVPRPAVLDALGVYLKPRVLMVLLLGFSAGLPLALSGSTLQVWMRESGVDLGTIGLFALVGTPYTIKFLWAPVVDALDLPLLSGLLGRRRAWLLLSQLLLMAAIGCLALSDPHAPGMVALAALMVATASATQDIVIDAFRVESLEEREQAAGMASYVAAYRIGMLVSTAGALFLVSAFESAGAARPMAWTLGYAAMAALVVIGIITTFVASEPEKSRVAQAAHTAERGHPLVRVIHAALGALTEFLGREQAIVALGFVVLYKLTDAFAGAMTAAFVIDIGFSRNQYAAIVKGLGLAATLLGGFAGGFIAGAYPLAVSLWIGGVLQAVANLAFSWQAMLGPKPAALAFAISAENFTSAIGTVIFVAYLSALCRNPLHTATQYALLTALSAVGRTYLSSAAGFVAAATGWPLFFAIAALVAIPGLLLLTWLQRGGHFATLETNLAPSRRRRPAAA